MVPDHNGNEHGEGIFDIAYGIYNDHLMVYSVCTVRSVLEAKIYSEKCAASIFYLKLCYTGDLLNEQKNVSNNKYYALIPACAPRCFRLCFPSTHSRTQPLSTHINAFSFDYTKN